MSCCARSSFSTPRILTLMHGNQEIGSIETGYVEHEELGKLTKAVRIELPIKRESLLSRSGPFLHGTLARRDGQAKTMADAGVSVPEERLLDVLLDDLRTASG